jgi:hypothetical protein
MEVKVPLKCGRCGRTEEKLVQMETAQAMVEEINQKAVILKNLKEMAGSIDSKLGPNVVLFIRKGEGYEVKTLDNLCEKPDAKRNKGCATRVNELMKDIFDLHAGEKKERKPRTPKDPNAPPKEKGGNGSKGRGGK